MRKKNIQPIKAEEASPINKSTVIGQFDGMCADADITNENGLDITREVWENVFNSDIYKKAIELGWLIGYLGHPNDPNCMNFMDACIVMKEGHIEDDGKVYGKFDLIDTPVGRIVKSFIDAGVTFGISVRGAGDIIDNSVDPDTFIFRGFDLVTFPAYTEAIPTFTAVAASSDIETQKKYKAVCAAVKKNIEGINTIEAATILQSQFAAQSDEYKLLEDRKQAILGEDNEEDIDIADEKVVAMTDLYLQAKTELDEANSKVKILQSQNATTRKLYSKKLKSIKRIMAAQANDLEDELFETTNNYQVIKASTAKLKDENSRLQHKATRLNDENSRLQAVTSSLQTQVANLKQSNKSYKQKIEASTQEITSLQTQVKDLKNSNLKYKQKVEASTNEMNEKESVISSLRSELNETVMSATELEARTSNRDATVKKLHQDIAAATKLIQDYQEAYANLYANALGVHIDNVTVTSTTTVDELKSIINGASASQPATSIMESTQIEDLVDVDYGDDDLITI